MMEERLKDIESFKQYLHRQYPNRRTAIDYSSDIRQFSASCSKNWREVMMQDIDKFVDQQRQAGKSAATVKRRVASLKVFFDFLAEETGELSWPNPVRFKRHAGKQAKRLPRDLSDEQVRQLWSVISEPRDRAWFALMLGTGLRVGEIIKMKLSDIVREPTATQPGQVRTEGKGQKERIVLLSSDVYAVLQDWLKVRPVGESETVFLNHRGQALSVSGIEWLLGRYSQQALGQHLTPHQLRHTFARQLTEAGMPITSLSKLLGHAQVSTTQIYTAGADPQLNQAYQAAMARLATAPDKPLKPPEAPQPERPKPVLPSDPLPPKPTWSEWATHLPLELRQATLEMVQQRWPTWKPQRRVGHARRILYQLRGYWDWQIEHRPIAQLAELTLKDLQAYQQARTDQGKATSTINRTLQHLMAILRQGHEQGQAIDSSVFRLRPLPRPDSLPRYLPETEILTLETFIRGRFADPDPLIRLENACFFVLAHCGLRASECVDLQFQDLDLSAKRLRVQLGKGQRDRIVPVSDTAIAALRLYLGQATLAPTDPLWLLPNGQLLTTNWLYTHMGALGRLAGHITLYPNRLRHTLATRLLNLGLHITQIQKLLGHQNINTTMIYARVLDHTLAADYQHAMHTIELQHLPFPNSPELVDNWPSPVPTQPASLPVVQSG